MILVDETAVDRAVAGEPVHLTPTERAAAIRRLTARGLSGRQIAGQLHVTPRTVHRTRSRQAVTPQTVTYVRRDGGTRIWHNPQAAP